MGEEGSQPLTYEEVLRLLPRLERNQLTSRERAAVEVYVRRHRHLLDRLERLQAGGTDAPAAPATDRSPPGRRPAGSAGPIPEGQATSVADPPPWRSAGAPPPSMPFSGVPATGPGVAWTRSPAMPRPVVLGAPAVNASARSQRLRWAVVALAAVSAMVLMLLYSLDVQRRLADLQGTLAGRESRLTQLEQERLQQSELLPFFSAPDQVVRLAGSEAGSPIRGVFYRVGSQARLLMDGLAAEPAGRAYQGWIVAADGTVHSAGLVQTAPQGPSRLAFTMPVSDRDMREIRVTLEPAGGSIAPTGPPIAQGAPE